MQSKIPRVSTAKKTTKLTTLSSNIPRKSIGKSRQSIVSTNGSNNLFKVMPTQQHMNSRQAPPEISGRQKIIGNEKQLETLFNYTRTLAQSMFLPGPFKDFYPGAFSTLKQSVQSSFSTKNQGSRKSSIAPSSGIDASQIDVNLANAYEILNNLLVSNTDVLLLITDFCLLYSAITIAVCIEDDNSQKALFFLKKLLTLDLPKRNNEFNVLFAVLLRTNFSSPIVRGHTIQVVSLLVRHDEGLISRLQAGTDYQNAAIASMCQEILQLVGGTDQSKQLTHLKSTFPSLNPTDDEDLCVLSLQRMNEYLENGIEVSDYQEIIRGIIITIERFEESASIIFYSSKCIISLLSRKLTIQTELLSQLLSLFLRVLRVGHQIHGNESFEARDSSILAIDKLFAETPPHDLFVAISGTIAIIDEEMLSYEMEMLTEYVDHNSIMPNNSVSNDIYSQIKSFHPEFSKIPHFITPSSNEFDSLDSMTDSIHRLLSSDTVFEEMEKIIQQDDLSIIMSYPVYLRGFLLRSYVLITGKIPKDIEDDQKLLIEEMLSQYSRITEEDLRSGSLSPDNLESFLNSLSS